MPKMHYECSKLSTFSLKPVWTILSMKPGSELGEKEGKNLRAKPQSWEMEDNAVPFECRFITPSIASEM